MSIYAPLRSGRQTFNDVICGQASVTLQRSDDTKSLFNLILGKQSLETICLLLAYKIKYPENFFLLRGNHECASINRIYGNFHIFHSASLSLSSRLNANRWSENSFSDFPTRKLAFDFHFPSYSQFVRFFSSAGFYDECKRRYNVKLWKTFTDCFNCLPIAAIIDEKIFCCHGGLSPDLHVRLITGCVDYNWPSSIISGHGADSPNNATDRRARHWTFVWSPLVGPRQGRARLGREWPRREFHLRCRHCLEVPQPPWLGFDLPGPPGRRRRLRVLCQTLAGHAVLRSKLLRRIRQRRRNDVSRWFTHVFVSSESKARP